MTNSQVHYPIHMCLQIFNYIRAFSQKLANPDASPDLKKLNEAVQKIYLPLVAFGEVQ